MSSNGTELTDVSPGVLSIYSGNILLIDAGTNIGDTVFGNVVEGDAFGAYTFTYALGGAAGQIGLTVIPEPSSLAVLSLGFFPLLLKPTALNDRLRWILLKAIVGGRFLAHQKA